MAKAKMIDKKYLVVDEIGQGGMGKVYKVQKGDEVFALKICVDLDEESIKRFKREVRLMATIKHKNVIKIVDANLDHEPPYFVMPLCRFSIDAKIDKLIGNPKQALDVLLQVCSGINAIHLSGVIHRDIKPKNILINANNTVKVSDLGLGKFKDRDSTILTSSNVYMGTQGFMPPEFFKPGGAKNADIRSDIYQLGKTIYNIFTNLSPSLIERDILPGGLLYIIQKCIADNPDHRYQTVGELENALNNYLLSLSPENNPANAFENSINIAKENIRANQYDSDNVESIVQLLFAFKDDAEIFFKQSNKIPQRIFEIIASNFPELCTQLTQTYSRTIEKYFKETHIDFSDAEAVAKTMNSVFKGSHELGIKVLTMQTTLFTSVYCNRYSAMDVFDNMLKSIKNDEDAVAVVEMLKENLESYEQVSERVPQTRLHPLIVKLQKDIQKKKEKREEEQRKDFTW